MCHSTYMNASCHTHTHAQEAAEEADFEEQTTNLNTQHAQKVADYTAKTVEAESTQVHKHMHARTHTCKNTQIRMYTHMLAHARAHTYSLFVVLSPIRSNADETICSNADETIYMHTHTHIHTRTHTHVIAGFQRSGQKGNWWLVAQRYCVSWYTHACVCASECMWWCLTTYVVTVTTCDLLLRDIVYLVCMCIVKTLRCMWVSLHTNALK